MKSIKPVLNNIKPVYLLGIRLTLCLHSMQVMLDARVIRFWHLNSSL